MKTVYNITGTTESKVKATKFVDNVPPEVMMQMMADTTGPGKVFFYRLMALESAGEAIDVAVPYTISGVNYAVANWGLTAEQASALIGTREEPYEEAVYEIGAVSGELGSWITGNANPPGTEFVWDHARETVTLRGTLPEPARRIR